MYQSTINFERIRERQQTEGYIPKAVTLMTPRQLKVAS